MLVRLSMWLCDDLTTHPECHSAFTLRQPGLAPAGARDLDWMDGWV